MTAAISKIISSAESLPALVSRAWKRLRDAKNSADVFEARDMAEAALHYAKLTKAANETQADCLRIIMRAETRMADEIDAGQARGEVATAGNPIVRGADNCETTFDDLGIDRRRVAEWRAMRDAGPDVVEEAIAGALARGDAPTKKDIRRAIRKASNVEVAARPVIIPPGKFGTIIIDPPWDMEKIERDVRPNQVAFDYPPMTEEELVAFGETVNRVAADNCHMFMWTTQRFLPMAQRLLDAWDFRYVYVGTWHKAGGYQPFGLPQYNAEHYLYARRGSPKFRETKNFFICFEAPRREHSRKPDRFYDDIRRVTDDGRIDIFSREKRDGFEQIGNEASKFEEVA